MLKQLLEAKPPIDQSAIAVTPDGKSAIVFGQQVGKSTRLHSEDKDAARTAFFGEVNTTLPPELVTITFNAFLEELYKS